MLAGMTLIDGDLSINYKELPIILKMPRDLSINKLRLSIMSRGLSINSNGLSFTAQALSINDRKLSIKAEVFSIILK